MSDAGEAVFLELDRVSRCYAATISGRTALHRALPVTTLGVRRGEWVAVTGVGTGPLTLLLCAAGLVRPDTGRVRWLDGVGREVGAPPVAIVHADAAPYDCWTVRDTLWAAAPCCSFDRAERRVALALRCCSLESVADRRVVELDRVERWRVNVAAAIAGGAGWLFLEPPSEPPPDALSTRSVASVQLMARSLVARGVGALVAAAAVVPFEVDRHVALATLGGEGEVSVDAAGALARVAESGGGAWERPGTGVASPLRQV
ncbi:MAG TPA: hypothetical protein VGE02_10040 [Gemmatimonadales bacterium]